MNLATVYQKGINIVPKLRDGPLKGQCQETLNFIFLHIRAERRQLPLSPDSLIIALLINFEFLEILRRYSDQFETYKRLYHRERILETSTLSCNEEKEEITKPPTK